jgi:hypothetical protein
MSTLADMIPVTSCGADVNILLRYVFRVVESFSRVSRVRLEPEIRGHRKSISVR